MRPAFLIVLSAVGGFAIGLAGSRVWTPRAESVTDDFRAGRGLAASSARQEESKTSEEKQASLMSLLEKPRDSSRDFQYYESLQKLTPSEFRELAPKMVARLKRLGETHQFAEQIGEVWMERWLEVDAAGALSFLKDTRLFDDLDPKGEWTESFAIWDLPFYGVFKAVARNDPEWTRNFLITIKDDSKREFGVKLLAEAAAQNLGPGGKKYIAEFLEGGNRKAAIAGYAAGLAHSSPSDAFQLAFGEPPGPFREEIMRQVLWAASSGGSAAARGLLDRIEDPLERARMAGQMIGNVAYRAGEDIKPWLAEEMKRAGTLGSRDFRIAWDWAIQESIWIGDFAALADWGLSLEVDKEHRALGRMLGDWTTRDFDKVQSWLGKNERHFDEAMVKSLDEELQQLVNRDPQDASKWAESLPNGALRNALQLKAAIAAAGAGDSAGLIALYPEISAKDPDGGVAKRFAALLSKADGLQAGAWALSLPPGKARDAAIRTVADEWGQRNPAAVAHWIEEIPQGPERDSAVEEYAHKVTYSDPAAGAEWVLEIEPQASREKAAERVFWTWKNENPGAATEWVRQLPGVSDAWREKTLRIRR